MKLFRNSLGSNVAPNSDSTCFVLQNGSLQPIAYSLAAQVHHPGQDQSTPLRDTPSVGSQSASTEKAGNISRVAEVLKDVNKKLDGSGR